MNRPRSGRSRIGALRRAFGIVLPAMTLTSACGAGTQRGTLPPQPPAAGRLGQTPSPSPTPGASSSATPAASIQPALVPLPASVQFVPGASFRVTASTNIVVDAGDPRAMFVGRFVAERLATVGNRGPGVIAGAAANDDGNITLILDGPASSDEESYELMVSSSAVRIRARTPAGLFYGAQTLRQMLPPFLENEAARPRPIVIPAVLIKDQPRFGWRGAMLDVARHFFSVDDVKRYLDLIALHKMNRLHLHLSDDQGWRIEIKSRPKLTAIGGQTEVGGGAGGFYTQNDYTSIVAYAAERFITVIPEVDIPGHTNAALASYPELNCDGIAPPLYTDIKVGFSVLCIADEQVYSFLDDVIREISGLTPGPYFHVGGDEVKKLTPSEYTGFINRAQDIVERHGKRMIGWDEVAHATLRPSSIVQHWRYDKGAELRHLPGLGVKLIMSPGNRTYLDMQYDTATALGLSWAGRIEIKDSYGWDPASLVPEVTESSVLGVEAPLWSETTTHMRDLESLAFPRLASIAEVGWTAQSSRDWESFRSRLAGQAARWQALGINFYRSPQIPWRN